MADLPSRSDLFAVARRAVINTPNQRINPAVIDIPGSDTNLLLGAMALLGEEIISQLATAMRGNFVEVARGDQLDRVAFDRYGLTRFAATPSHADIVLSRPLPGVATPGTYPAGSRIQTPDGTQFATDIDAVFADFTLSVSITATALVAGPDSNVSAGDINQFADQPFDPNLIITSSRAAGGNDAESDVDFRGRIRDFFPTVRRGTLGAIEFGARQVPGIVIATAIELVNTLVPGDPIPAGMVQLIVGDNEGNATAGLIQQVIDTLIDFRAAGIPVQVIGGTPITEAVQWDIDYVTGVDTSLVQAQVRAVTSATAQFLNPGETLLRSSLIAAARTVPGAIINAGSLLVPAGDIVPANPNEVIRVPLNFVTFPP